MWQQLATLGYRGYLIRLDWDEGRGLARFAVSRNESAGPVLIRETTIPGTFTQEKSAVAAARRYARAYVDRLPARTPVH